MGIFFGLSPTPLSPTFFLCPKASQLVVEVPSVSQSASRHFHISVLIIVVLDAKDDLSSYFVFLFYS